MIRMMVELGLLISLCLISNGNGQYIQGVPTNPQYQPLRNYQNQQQNHQQVLQEQVYHQVGDDSSHVLLNPVQHQQLALQPQHRLLLSELPQQQVNQQRILIAGQAPPRDYVKSRDYLPSAQPPLREYHAHAQPHSYHAHAPMAQNQGHAPMTHNPGHAPPPSQFASRSGLTDFLSSFTRPNGPTKKSDSLPPSMRDMHRVPKPPKYPLYDLDSISMATPPPAPIMHPMASLPSDQFPVYTGPSASPSINRPHRVKPGPGPPGGGRTGGGGPPSGRPLRPTSSSYTNRRGPPGRPPKPHSSKGPPHSHNSRYRQRPPLSGGKPRPPPPGPPRSGSKDHRNHDRHHVGGHHVGHGKGGPHGHEFDEVPQQQQDYISSPMASNLEAIKTSPALGRPLGFDEYMARPSHSYVNDPWNFDPFANQMNQGLNTHALKYNYDPLGMNNLEMSGSQAMSHLDPNKLSYPGDSFVKDSDGQSRGQQNGANSHNHGGGGGPPPKSDWGGAASEQIQYQNHNDNGRPNNQFNRVNGYQGNNQNQFNNEPNRNFNDFNPQQQNQFNQNNNHNNFNNNFNSNQGNQGNKNGQNFNPQNNIPHNSQPNNNNNYNNNHFNNGNQFGGNQQQQFDNRQHFDNRHNFDNVDKRNNNYENFDKTPITSDNERSGSSPQIVAETGSPSNKIEFTIETSVDENDKNQIRVLTNGESISDEGLSNVYDPYSSQFSDKPLYGPNGYESQDIATPNDMLPPVNTAGTNFYTDYPLADVNTNTNLNTKRERRRKRYPNTNTNFNNANLEGIHIFQDIMNNHQPIVKRVRSSIVNAIQ